MLAKLLRAILALAILIALSLAAWLHISFQWPLPLALTIGLATPLAAHAGLLSIEFVLTYWLGRHSKLPNDAQQLYVGGIMRAWLTEIPTAIRVFGLQMPWTGHLPLPSAAEPTRIPVVLIHGYFCNRALFRSMATHLAARGHPIESVNLEPVFGSIDQYPELIAKAVKKAILSSVDGRVALLGHSMGGIAARAYMRDFGDSAIAQIITLGSPHQGTLLARIGHTKIVRQLRPANPWLDGLAQLEPVSRYQRFTVVLSAHDNIVTPQKSQTLPGASTVCIAGLGHVDLACHPTVFAVIDAALDKHRPRQTRQAYEEPPTPHENGQHGHTPQQE